MASNVPPFSSGPPFFDGPPFGASSKGIDTVPKVYSVDPNSGRIAGGTSVTITGDNFRNSSEGVAPIVKFGGVVATSVIVVNTQTITCSTPVFSAPELVDVSVTCGMQTGTLYGAFTYYASIVLSIAPDHATFNGGTEVLIKGANFVAGSAVYFGTSAATGVTIVDSETIICVTPNHAKGSVDVKVQEPGLYIATLRNGFRFTLLTRGEDIRRSPGISIRDVLNNQANTCSFVVDGDSSPPAVGEQIEITDSFDGDRLLFAGNVQTVDQEFDELTDQLHWAVNCVDFTKLLNKYRPVGKFDNVSAGDVVKSLITRFAPGFTTDFVQTRLAKVTATFDGSQDFSTCLNNIAEAIGGGHWYVDYQQRVHFFHQVPQGIIPPTSPVGVIQLGPGNAPTVVEGAAIPAAYSFSIGFYAFRTSFVYENGVESALGPLSNFVPLQGTNQIVFSNIAIGAAVGTHTVVKRRMYYYFIGPTGIVKLERFAEINDNSTTGFTTFFGAIGSTVATVVAPTIDWTLPAVPYVAPPAGSPLNFAADRGVQSIFTPQYPPLFGAHTPMSYTPGPYAFKVTNIYRDGTESLPSPASSVVVLRKNGDTSALLSGIPVGQSINSVDVIARKVYASFGSRGDKPLSQVVAELQYSHDRGTVEQDWSSVIGIIDSRILQSQPSVPTTYDALSAIIGVSDIEYLLHPVGDPDWSPDHTAMWYFIYDNTTTRADVGPGTGAGVPPGQQNPGPDDDIPVWPNPDGPWLEDFSPPAHITNTDPLLLREPATQFRSSIDMTQLRNRIFVRGAGAAAVAAAAVGASRIEVTEVEPFSVHGGLLTTGFQVLEYSGLTQASGQAEIILKKPLGKAVQEGDAVNLYFMAEDKDSQRALGKVELDKDGKPTDGVHEYTIVDTSLVNPFQLYMRAYAELELFAWPIVSIHYSTRDPNTRSGAIVTVDLTNPPCKGEFLIQDVTIDQIHDESDQLAPRYTASASSVKFELTDLLLKIVSGRIGDTGVSFAGVVQSTAPVEVDAVTTNMLIASQKKPIWMYHGNPSSVTSYVMGCTISAAGALQSDSIESRNNWRRATTSTSANALAYPAASTQRLTWVDMDPIWQSHVRIPSITDERVWACLLANGDPPSASDNYGQKAIGFRYSHGVDTGWTPFHHSGASMFIGPTLGVLQANGEYILTVRVENQGAIATFFMTDLSTGNTLSSTMSLSADIKGTALFGYSIAVRNSTTTAKAVDYAGFHLAYGANSVVTS